MGDDSSDWREGYDQLERRTTYDEDGAATYEYNEMYDTTKKSKGGSSGRRGGPPADGILGALLGFAMKIAGFLFLKLPFALVGFAAGYGVWNRFSLDWPICAAIGLAVFGLVLLIVNLFGRLVRKVPGPWAVPLRVLEVVVVAGVQFGFVLGIAFSLFMPKEVQTRLVSEQASYFAEHDVSDRISGIDVVELQQRYASGAVSSDQFLKELSEGVSGVDMVFVFVESQKVYYSSFFGIVREDNDVRLWIGVIAPLLIAAVAGFFVYRMHDARFD